MICGDGQHVGRTEGCIGDGDKTELKGGKAKQRRHGLKGNNVLKQIENNCCYLSAVNSIIHASGPIYTKNMHHFSLSQLFFLLCSVDTAPFFPSLYTFILFL